MSWRNSKEYRIWKYECLRLADATCQITGAKTNLHVHHINHATYFPDLKYEISNGIVMHRAVHYLFHYLVMGGSRKKCDEKDLKRFIRLFKFVRLISKFMNK